MRNRPFACAKSPTQAPLRRKARSNAASRSAGRHACRRPESASQCTQTFRPTQPWGCLARARRPAAARVFGRGVWEGACRRAGKAGCLPSEGTRLAARRRARRPPSRGAPPGNLDQLGFAGESCPRREGILPSLRAPARRPCCRPEESAPIGTQGRQNAFPPKERASRRDGGRDALPPRSAPRETRSTRLRQRVVPSEGRHPAFPCAPAR